MKKNFRAVLLAIGVFFMSCQENNQQIRTNPFEQIGILHNQILDRSFYKLKELKAGSKNPGSLAVLEVLQKTALETILGQENKTEGRAGSSYASSYNSTEINYIESMIDTTGLTGRNIFQYYSHSDGQPFVDKAYADALVFTKTENELLYGGRIISLFKDEKTNLSETLTAYAQLEQEIMNTCTAEEQAGLLSAIAVAKHSASYWSTNAIAWQKEFGTSETIAKVNGGPNWKMVGGFDVAAAVGVGVVASPLLGGPFIGWAAYAGLVGGATAIVSGVAVWAFWGDKMMAPSKEVNFEKTKSLFVMPRSIIQS